MKKIFVWPSLVVALLLTLIVAAFKPTEQAAVNPSPIHVALVFDDGPFPDHADKLLAVLAKEQVKVTFALVASNVHKFPSSAKAIIGGGHEVASHSYLHRHPKDLDDVTMEQEIVMAQTMITETTGYTPKWYWPPFLEMDDRMHPIAAKAGVEIYSLENVVDSKDHNTSCHTFARATGFST